MKLSSFLCPVLFIRFMTHHQHQIETKHKNIKLNPIYIYLHFFLHWVWDWYEPFWLLVSTQMIILILHLWTEFMLSVQLFRHINAIILQIMQTTSKAFRCKSNFMINLRFYCSSDVFWKNSCPSHTQMGSQAFKWKKLCFFVIPEMPSKTFVML